jgi:phosphoribosyl-ATP pyrophosphohydrolase
MEEEFGELKEALNDNSKIVHEAADTIYHLLVTLEAANIKFEDVLDELEKRKNRSGFEEKKNRLI